jgi:hypothetical protein
MFNNFIQWHYFYKGPFNFHNRIYFILNFFYGNGVLSDTSKKHSNFHIFWFRVYQKLNLKVLTCFRMIGNYNKFSRQNTKSGKIYAFSKICISPNLIVKKKDILGQLWIQYINFFKTFHLKIPLEENMFFGKKNLKRDNSFKCKINTLVRYMSFGPT